MMTPEEILDRANRAYHEGRIADWRAWFSLLHILGHAPDGKGGLVIEAQSREEAQARIAAPRLIRTEDDDLQFDYEREAQAQGVNLTELMR